MQKTLSPQSTVPERRLLFDASMHLIGNGKFLNATMQEIAYQARMSEATIVFIFENRPQLLGELIEHVSGNISAIITDTTGPNMRPFKERFFDLWKRLFNYYTSHPALPAFLQQFDVLAKSARSIAAYPGNSQRLIDFFRSAGSGVIEDTDMESVAYIFHENVVTASQMKLRNRGDARRDMSPDRSDAMIAHMPEMLWSYLVAESSR